MMGFNFIYSAFVLAVSALYSLEILSVFQQCGYTFRDYFGFLFRNKRVVFTYLVISIVFAATGIVAYFSEYLSFIYSITVFAAAVSYYFVYKRNLRLRIRVVFTKRMTRIALLHLALSYSVTAAICQLIAFFSGVVTILYPLLLPVAAYILSPCDALIYKREAVKCEKTLKSKNNLIKIGITGSCGKTTVKKYLLEFLKEKYMVYATPKSFNTPMGICLAVKDMPPDTEVFIAEMGAKRKGDIAELCNIVKPSIGVITAIEKQHLETFGSLENIKNTKNELIEGLATDGYAVFSADSEGSRELFERAKVKKSCVGIKGDGKATARNIRYEGGRLFFDLILGGKKFPIKSKLIGRHNVTNICLAAAVAMRLGVSPPSIARRVKELIPPEHRLNIISGANGVTVIDDGYNANLKGIEGAAEALGSFGGSKYAVTSGIVEAGAESREMNERVGETLAKTADYIVAVGKNSEAILDGARKNNCEGVSVKTLDEAKEILKKRVKRGDTVIFINDLPDKYL